MNIKVCDRMSLLEFFGENIFVDGIRCYKTMQIGTYKMFLANCEIQEKKNEEKC